MNNTQILILVCCIGLGFVYTLVIISGLYVRKNTILFKSIITEYGIYDVKRGKAYYACWMERYPHEPVVVYRVHLFSRKVSVFNAYARWLGFANLVTKNNNSGRLEVCCA